MTSSSQRRRLRALIRFLREPASYPHCPRRIALRQTHISIVALAGPYAYKVKKPVDFGFLDFSTLDRRHDSLDQERILNRRLCPGIYLSVVPIFRRGSQLTFQPRGNAVEYTLKMRRLGDAGFLDQRLRRGRLTAREMDRVAETLISFYRDQKHTAGRSPHLRVKFLRKATRDNFHLSRPFIGQGISAIAHATIRSYTSRFYRRHTPALESRVAGHWQDCHGDLRLEHIHLTPKQVRIYDCIEFAERLRYIDVANDVAFLAMDLDFHGRRDLSLRLSSRIARVLGDPAMPGLLDFYKCYRAFVRGKVHCLKSNEPEASASQRHAATEEARRYFRLSLSYAIAGSKPTVLILMGRIGTGKSTLARRLKAELGWPAYASDEQRKRLAGVPLYTRSPETVRRRLYQPAVSEGIYRTLLADALDAIQRRGYALVEATFSRPEYRRLFSKELDQRGVSYFFIETTSPDFLIKKRLRERETSSPAVSDARLEDFELLTQTYRAPDEIPRSHRFQISTRASLETSALKLLKSLAALEAGRDLIQRPSLCPSPRHESNVPDHAG